MTDMPSDQNARQRLLVQDKQRLADVNSKHERVRRLLDDCGADALLLRDPANIAWFSAGADLTRLFTEYPTSSVFITPEARLFGTNAVDSAQIFEREAFGLGFQLKQREWFQSHDELLQDLCRGRKVIADTPATFDECSTVRIVPHRIQNIRWPLTDLEVIRLRKLSRAAVHAVEAAARHLTRGSTEAMVAGEVAHRLIKRTITPTKIRVCADGRIERYRHWTYGDIPVQNYATISVVAKRWGLHSAVTRTACIDQLPDRLWDAHQKAVLLHGTAQFFSRSGKELGDIWSKIHRIYDKFGVANEWLKADQGSVIGYGGTEERVLPGSNFELASPMPVYWHASTGPAMMGDTILSHDKSIELLTHSKHWPQLTVHVKGHALTCPGILRVPSESNHSAADASENRTADLFESFDDSDEGTARIDSIWEMDLNSDLPAFEDSNVQYS